MAKSSILNVSSDPEPTPTVVFRKTYFFKWMKQPSKTFKKLYLTESRFKTPRNSKHGTTCNNSLQLKVVNYSIVTRSSILDVGRGPGPASDYCCISQKFLAVTKGNHQRYFENIMCYFSVNICYEVGFEIGVFLITQV